MTAHDLVSVPSRGLVYATGLLIAAVPALAQETHRTQHLEVDVEIIARDLEHPWGLALLPDGRFLVTERNPGHLRLGEAGGELSEPLGGVPRSTGTRATPIEARRGCLWVITEHPDGEVIRLSRSGR